jgi:beta-RFAP synthase
MPFARRAVPLIRDRAPLVERTVVHRKRARGRIYTLPTLAARAAPILETVVTTINADGSVNCAAMGVEWGELRIVIKPFRGTRTLRNLRATEAAVVHLTDDILLFSQSALGDPRPPTHPAVSVEGAVLDDACSWREVRVEAIDDAEPRARVSTVVVNSGIGREFLGLNRARHAVLEASILASRARLLDAENIRAEVRRLQVLVDKTAGPREREAMAYVAQRARSGRRPVSTVRVEAPARLHLGMLAVGGVGARSFGGLGVSIGRPAVMLEAQPADDLSVEGAEAERALTFAQRSREMLGLPGGAHLHVVETIPPHVGLGSGTKLALAVAQALAALHGRRIDAPALAQAAGRAARSAVGTWTFALGGLVVEGGVRGGAARPAPLLMRHPVPDEWRIVLVVPKAEPGLSGVAEAQAFERLVPSAELSAAIAQLVLTSLLPALVERDLDEFGGALTRVQQLVGDAFASVQDGRFHPRAGPLVQALLRGGAAGAGQSSWGPAVYGVVGSEAAGRDLARRIEDVVGGDGSVELVAFDNRGARVERS